MATTPKRFTFSSDSALRFDGCEMRVWYDPIHHVFLKTPRVAFSRDRTMKGYRVAAASFGGLAARFSLYESRGLLSLFQPRPLIVQEELAEVAPLLEKYAAYGDTVAMQQLAVHVVMLQAAQLSRGAVDIDPHLESFGIRNGKLLSLDLGHVVNDLASEGPRYAYFTGRPLDRFGKLVKLGYVLANNYKRFAELDETAGELYTHGVGLDPTAIEWEHPLEEILEHHHIINTALANMYYHCLFREELEHVMTSVQESSPSAKRFARDAELYTLLVHHWVNQDAFAELAERFLAPNLDGDKLVGDPIPMEPFYS